MPDSVWVDIVPQGIARVDVTVGGPTVVDVVTEVTQVEVIAGPRVVAVDAAPQGAALVDVVVEAPALVDVVTSTIVVDVITGEQGPPGPPGQDGVGRVTIADVGPSGSQQGDLWWDSGDTTQLYVWYVDPTGPGQWVVANSGLPGGGGGGLPEAPADGQLYSRRGSDASWQVSPGAGGGGIPDAPSNSVAYGRENGGWVPVLALSGDVLDGGNF